MNPMRAPSFAFRVWHQFALEWRAQWFLVLLWLAALATGCSFIVKAPEETPASPAELIRLSVDAALEPGALAGARLVFIGVEDAALAMTALAGYDARDPYALDVTVTIDGKERVHVSTSEISHKVEAVFAWLGMVCPVTPGTVIGLGTTPDCTGLDHADFLDPGAIIAISIERLGSLRCRFAEPAGTLLPSRWPVRPSMEKYFT